MQSIASTPPPVWLQLVTWAWQQEYRSFLIGLVVVALLIAVWKL